MIMILIILSVAAYLGIEDDVFERERDFFAKVLPKLTGNKSKLKAP